MKHYYTYQLETGEILWSGQCNDDGLALQVAPPGCQVVEDSEGTVRPSTHYVRDGKALPIPGAPGSGLVFDYGSATWTTPTVSRADLVDAAMKQRHSLLLASDWTQLPDVPNSLASEWQVYRQALRDITTQPGYPEQINWPVKPS